MKMPAPPKYCHLRASLLVCLTLACISKCEGFLGFPCLRGKNLGVKSSQKNLSSVAATRKGISIYHEEQEINGDDCSDRRKFMSALLSGYGLVMTGVLIGPSSSGAIELRQSPDDPTITHRVKFNVRISRSDGTFYVRDEPNPSPDNQVFTGSLSFGLYGDFAPNHVKRFLNYVDVNYSPGDDTPLPSYARSQFTTLNQATGLLTGGVIPGLHVTKFNGGSAIEYYGRISSGSLWVDDFKGKTRISHNRAGLLTHKNFDVLPDFGITTRSSPELNDEYTVFGTVLPTITVQGEGGENNVNGSKEFLRICIDLPTYSNSRPVTPIGQEEKATARAVEEVASSVYSFQKDLFRSAAKTFGDTRLDNVYEGKILRRIEVTSVNFETV